MKSIQGFQIWVLNRHWLSLSSIPSALYEKDRINVDGADLTGIVAVEAPADVLEKDLGWVHVAEGVHGRRVLLVHAV